MFVQYDTVSDAPHDMRAVQAPTQAGTIFVSGVAIATGLCIGASSLGAMSAAISAARSSKVSAKGLSVRAAPVSHPNDMLMQCTARTRARRRLHRANRRRTHACALCH